MGIHIHTYSPRKMGKERIELPKHMQVKNVQRMFNKYSTILMIHSIGIFMYVFLHGVHL